jgi:hypothetical protein
MISPCGQRKRKRGDAAPGCIEYAIYNETRLSHMVCPLSVARYCFMGASRGFIAAGRMRGRGQTMQLI